jgi:hypothetical protein
VPSNGRDKSKIIESSTLNDRATTIHSALRNRSAFRRARGESTVHNAGTLTTATGNNVAAITATESPTIVTADPLVGTMASASTASPSWL